MRKKKEKNRCCEALCLNMQTQKFAKIFENIYIQMLTFCKITVLHLCYFGDYLRRSSISGKISGERH